MAIEVSKTRDWSRYNAAAKKSGAISFYISQEAITAWLKLHTAVNVHNNHIEAFGVTANNVANCEVARRLLKAIRDQVLACSGDGAYDAEVVYQAAQDIGAILVVPPRRDARLQDPANAITAKAPRDAAITYIHQHGANEEAGKDWKKVSGYHARSLAETSMYRFKRHCCSSVRSRTFENQCAEIAIKVKIINKIAGLETFPLNRSEALDR
jgi:hypothetical protein